MASLLRAEILYDGSGYLAAGSWTNYMVVPPTTDTTERVEQYDQRELLIDTPGPYVVTLELTLRWPNDINVVEETVPVWFGPTTFDQADALISTTTSTVPGGGYSTASFSGPVEITQADIGLGFTSFGSFGETAGSPLWQIEGYLIIAEAPPPRPNPGPNSMRVHKY